MALCILALAVLAALAGGCAEKGPTQLTVTFRTTGEEPRYEYEIDCDSLGGSVAEPRRVCSRISESGDVLFLPKGVECPLPVPTVYANVSGTYLGEEVRRILSPCTDAQHRALTEWAALLGFVHPYL